MAWRGASVSHIKNGIYGATVGSVRGMANGIKSIPNSFKDPIADKLNTSIFGVGSVKITDMAKKTLEHTAF